MHLNAAEKPSFVYLIQILGSNYHTGPVFICLSRSLVHPSRKSGVSVGIVIEPNEEAKKMHTHTHAQRVCEFSVDKVRPARRAKGSKTVSIINRSFRAEIYEPPPNPNERANRRFCTPFHVRDGMPQTSRSPNTLPGAASPRCPTLGAAAAEAAA